MMCSTAKDMVGVRTVAESREALVTGAPVRFKDGTAFEPLPELLGYLQMAADLRATCMRFTIVPNVLAYYITSGNITRYVVQYPTYDSPYADEEDGDSCVEFAVVSISSGAWPCLKCRVIDGGSLRIWPSAVPRDMWTETADTIHEVCLVHGTVEDLSWSDDDYVDQQGEFDASFADHADWCLDISSCCGECLD